MPTDEQVEQQGDEQREQQPAQPDWQSQLAEANARFEAKLAEERAARERERVEAESRRQQEILALAQSVSGLNEPQREPEDDGMPLTKSELKKHLAEFGQTFAGAAQTSISNETSSILKNQRAINQQLAKSDASLTHFAKLQPEIDALLDKMHPAAAATADAYRKVYNVVASQHPELRESELASERERIKAELLAELRGDDDDDDEVVVRPTFSGQSQPAPRREPPMPRSDGGRGQAVASPNRQAAKASAVEKWQAERWFGGDVAALRRERDQPSDGWSMFREKPPAKG